MRRILIGRRLAAGLTAALAAVAMLRCTPETTEGNPGGGGGGGGPTAARLNFTQQPGTVARGQSFSPPVRVVVADSDFVAVTGSSAPVTLSAINGTLLGTTTRNASNGTAVMSDIRIDTAGAYTLVATSPGLIPDTSDQFFVLPLTVDTITIEVGSDTASSQILFRSRRNHTVNPAVDTIAVGGTVRWLWQGNLTHGVLINTGTVIYDSGAFTAPHAEYLTFNTADTYQFICSQHGNLMNGRIVVR